MRIGFLLSLGLVLSIPVLANEPVSEVDTDFAYENLFRVPDSCGCEEGDLYVYRISHDNKVSKRLLQSYGSKQACLEGMNNHSQCE